MAYIEEKTIKGKKYYYLTETKRVKGKFKKKRKYLGTKIPKDIERYIKKRRKNRRKKKRATHYLTKRQRDTIDKIKKNLSLIHI